MSLRLAVVAGVVALALALMACQPQQPLEVYGSAPDFTLTDQTGASFASSSLAGQVTVLNFIYTHCTDACPLLSATFQQVQRKLADDKLLGTRVTLVSLSVDPFHDTPPVLAEYGQQFKADPAGWKFLTGDWDQVYDVVTGLKVATRPPRPAVDAPAPSGTELTHSTRIIIIDPQQQVRAYLEGQDVSSDDVVNAARKLVVR